MIRRGWFKTRVLGMPAFGGETVDERLDWLGRRWACGLVSDLSMQVLGVICAEGLREYGRWRGVVVCWRLAGDEAGIRESLDLALAGRFRELESGFAPMADGWECVVMASDLGPDNTRVAFVLEVDDPFDYSVLGRVIAVHHIDPGAVGGVDFVRGSELDLRDYGLDIGSISAG